jgi:hypothetical protein
VLDDADAIWNRACDPDARLSGAGDRALQAVLLVDGQVMNGGLASALEYRSADEIEGAIRGFEYFGRHDVGDLLRQAMEVAFPAGAIADPDEREEHMLALPHETHQRLEELENRYHALVAQDGTLEDMFRQRLRTSPRDFAALD